MRTKFLLLVLAVLSFTIPAAAQAGESVYATAQRFENGLMIWRGDTGEIWALVNDGQAYHFPAHVYASLPDNPIFGTPPSRLRPIFGMGKVWGHYSHIRDALGWPTLEELGFDMPVREAGGTTYFTQLDRSVIQINPDNTWTRLGGEAGPAVLSFSLTPNPAAPGGDITLSWRVDGTEYALIEVYNANSNQVPLEVFEYLPLRGTLTYRLPAEVTDSARFVVWGANRSDHPVPVTLWERVVSAGRVVNIATGDSTTIQTQAAFQQYENGFMIWRGDTGEVLVFGNAGQLIKHAERVYAVWPDVPADYDIPPNRVRPVNAFGKVWGHDDEARAILGFATGVEQRYGVTLRIENGAAAEISLPDGRVANVMGRGNVWRF